MKKKRIFEPTHFDLAKENNTQGWIMPYTHYHESYEIYILTSGERTVTIDGKEYTVGVLDVTMFDKNVPHTSRGTTPYSGVSLHVNDRFIDYYFSPAAKKNLLECFNQPIIRLKQDELDKIKNTVDNFVPNSPSNFVVLADLLTIINNAALRIDPERMPCNANLPLTKTMLILKYVDENYMFIKNVAEIASVFNVSESFIYKLYKNKHNTSPKSYINELRLANARFLLETSDQNIKSVSFNSGFNSYEYFMRVFKSTHGCTPGEYRAAYQTKIKKLN